MNDIEVSSIDLVEGGNVFKQGHYLTLGYVPRDEKGETVDLSGKTLNVSLWGRKGVVFEAAATYSAGVIRFTLDKMVPAGDYTVEFTVTSSTDSKYRKKFPTNQHSGRIAIKQSADDLGVVGIQVYTVAQLKAEQKAIQTQYESTVDAKVQASDAKSTTALTKSTTAEATANDVKSQFEQVVISGDSSVEAAAARVAPDQTFVSLKARLDTKEQATAAQLAETAKGLSFAPSKNKTQTVYGSSEPRYLDNVGDGYLYGSFSRSLYRATSESGPWTLIKAFTEQDAINGIRKLGDGEMLMIRSTDGLWKSTGWGINPLTATWRQVLVTNGRTTQFSIDADPISGWVTATTYINGDMTNARYVWLSKDNGNTFTQIFDMLDYEPTINKTHSHLHIATMDTYHNKVTPRIWISYHKTADDPTNNSAPIKRIKYSDNAGVSWVDFSNAGFQPVAAIATPEGMLFGSDEGLVGVYIVRRKANSADMKYELFYAIRENIDGIFGWATKVIKGENGAYHFAFRSSVGGYSARVISSDGINVAETLKITPATGTDSVDLVDIVEYKGKLLGTYYNSATGGGAAYKLVADAPTRGVPENVEVGALKGGVAEALGTAGGFNSKTEMRGTAFGSNSLAKLRGIAVGEQSLAEAEGTAVGSEAKANGNGVVVGKSATVETGVTIGRSALSTGDGTSAGPSAKAITESIAFGSFASAQQTQSTALGRLALAGASYAVAIGALANATGIGSIALGRNSKATHDYSVALGFGTQTTFANQLKVGNKHIEINNVATPSSFPLDGIRLFSRLNGAGKTELCALFPSGSAVVIATQP